MKELNKNIQDLKMEVETIKKSQRETTLETGNIERKSGVIDISITNIIQVIEARISGAKYTLENIDTTVKENAICKKLLTPNIQEIQNTMRRPNLRIIGIEKSKDTQFKGPVDIFKKFIKENFPNLKKEMDINIQEAYRTPNRMDQKRNSSHHIIIKTPNALNKESILKTQHIKADLLELHQSAGRGGARL